MRDIEFVSYDGEYPNLCSGKLVLKIDGKQYSERYCLQSGGAAYIDGADDIVQSGPWTVSFDKDISKLNLTKQELDYITHLVNENVPHGCCGGCL